MMTKMAKKTAGRKKKASTVDENQLNKDELNSKQNDLELPPAKRTRRTRKSTKTLDLNDDENSIADQTTKTTQKRPTKKSITPTAKPDELDKPTEETVESVENAVDFNIDIMRKIFYTAQFIQKCNKCVQSLYKLIKEVKFEVFYEEFCRNVKCALQYDSDNPKAKCILDMIATFMISVKNENLLKNKINEDSFDEIGLELFGKDTFEIAKISKTYKNLLDYILTDALIPFLNSINVNTRLNTLYLVRSILEHVVDIQFDIYERLKISLIDRISDKNANVRILAAKTLYRYQNIDDPTDKVMTALQFHLKHDNVDTVRLECLKAICANEQVLNDIVLKTRDIRSRIREVAFMKIAKKVSIKDSLTTDQRLALLNNGFKDRNEKVQKAVNEFLVPAWIKSYDEDIIELLNDLDVIVNVDIISKFLESIFQNSFSIKHGKRTKLHSLIDKFYEEYLDEHQSLLTKKPLSPENCLFWRCLGAFLKKNEDQLLKYQPDLENRMNLKKEINSLLDAIDDLDIDQSKLNSTALNKETNDQERDEENKEKTDAETNRDQNEFDQNKSNDQTTNNDKALNEQSSKRDDQTAFNQTVIEMIEEQNESMKENPFDQILPNLSNFISFFKNFCLQVNQAQHENEELFELNFIFKELCLFLDNYDIEDDSQKQLVINLAEEIIMMEELGEKFDEYIDHLMRYLSKSVVKTNEELIDYTVDITNKVEASLENEDIEEELPMVDPKMIRNLELDFARESIAYNELINNLDHAVYKKEYDVAHGIKQEVVATKEKMDKIKNEINRMQNISIRQRPEPEIEIDIKDHPAVHVKLLQIFGCCLRYGQFKNLTSMMDTRITRYILPGFLSLDSRTRYFALKALNYACFLSSSLSARFYALYHEICTKDNQVLQVCGLQGLIDSLVEHGVHILYAGDDFPDQQQSTVNQIGSDSFIENQTSTDGHEAIKKSNANSIFTNTREFTKASSFLNKSEITSPNSSMNDSMMDDLKHNTNNESDLDRDDEDDEFNEHQANLTLKSQIIDPNKTALQLEKEEEIIKQLTKFLLKFIRSDAEEIKATSVMGICKLLLLGRIYSPLLLSELILLWYNSSTSLPIQHDIGTFLPIYCLASATYKIEIPENFSGQHCLLECFMSTVENVYRLERGEQLEISFDLMRSNYYDSDIDVLNVIDFMLNLLEPSNHIKIVFEFCGKILDTLRIVRDDEYELKELFMTKYLIRSLESFKLFELTDEQADELKQLVQAIQSETRYLQLKKQFITKIEKFYQKLG